VGSASVWDEHTRAQRASGRSAPPPPREGPPTVSLAISPEELEALVAGIVQVTLDTRLESPDPLRRAQLERLLQARLLELLGGTPASVPVEAEPSGSEPAALPPADALPEVREIDSLTGSPLGQALESRLSRLGGVLSARPDLRARLIALVVERVADPDPGDATGASGDELRSLDVLQRRAAKLERSLHESRAALAYVSGLEYVDPGIASIHRAVQGLSLEDPLRERKRVSLESLFRANLALQKPDQVE